MPTPSYTELKSIFEARKAHLLKPDGVNQLYLSDFVSIKVRGRPVQHVLLVMDYFSRYLLTLKLYSTATADVFIAGLENALEEAMRNTRLDPAQIITLVTGDGRAMTAAKTAIYIEMSPFYHVCGKNPHPYTRGMMPRLIRTIKEEGLSPDEYGDPVEGQRKLELFRIDYNQVRPHQALKYKTPGEVYTGKDFRTIDRAKNASLMASFFPPS